MVVASALAPVRLDRVNKEPVCFVIGRDFDDEGTGQVLQKIRGRNKIMNAP